MIMHALFVSAMLCLVQAKRIVGSALNYVRLICNIGYGIDYLLLNALLNLDLVLVLIFEDKNTGLTLSSLRFYTSISYKRTASLLLLTPTLLPCLTKLLVKNVHSTFYIFANVHSTLHSCKTRDYSVCKFFWPIKSSKQYYPKVTKSLVEFLPNLYGLESHKSQFCGKRCSNLSNAKL